MGRRLVQRGAKSLRARIGTEIRRAIESRGLTQAYIAQKLNVSPTSVSKWISGSTSPDLETLRDLCRLTFTPPSRILLMDSFGGNFDELAGELEGILKETKLVSDRNERLQEELRAFLGRTSTTKGK